MPSRMYARMQSRCCCAIALSHSRLSSFLELLEHFLSKLSASDWHLYYLYKSVLVANGRVDLGKDAVGTVGRC